MKRYCYYCKSYGCTVQSCNYNRKVAAATLARHLDVSVNDLVLIGINL